MASENSRFSVFHIKNTPRDITVAKRLLMVKIIYIRNTIQDSSSAMNSTLLLGYD